MKSPKLGLANFAKGVLLTPVELFEAMIPAPNFGETMEIITAFIFAHIVSAVVGAFVALSAIDEDEAAGIVQAQKDLIELANPPRPVRMNYDPLAYEGDH